MSEKKTLQQKLHARRLKKAPKWLYTILTPVVKILNRKINTHFEYRAYPGKDDEPFVLISNHASRNDYLFTAPVCLPHCLNYVVGYNEFFRFPLGILLRMLQAVPKKNFTPDSYTIMEILRLNRHGANICFMPEGMSSITGMAQPVIPGGGKLLKKLGRTVYYTKISGGYLTYTKHCLDERKGRVDVVVDRMFTPEELKKMTPEEIEDRMNMLLAHDDYIWNREQQIPFRGPSPMTKALDTLLYMCPKCGSMYRMKTGTDTMTCTECGNTIKIDECYNISAAGEDSVCPELITDWTIMERKRAAEDVRKEGFSFSEHVRIGMLPKYRYLKGDDTSEICGEGILTLDGEGLHFRGSARGEEFCFDLTTDQVLTYGMCTDISRLYTFVDGEFVEFYFDDGDVLRWDHLTEEMHRFKGGKWQDTQYRHC